MGSKDRPKEIKKKKAPKPKVKPVAGQVASAHHTRVTTPPRPEGE
ncbi:MAG: hypothetical protein ACYDAY_06760 [Candidatus Dormibacteria bacterium]